MQNHMSQEWWNPPDWLAPGAAWVASLVAAGGAKPLFDWWQGRGKEQREVKQAALAEKKLENDAATELREELRKTVREMRADLTRAEGETDAVRREMYELLSKVAALTAENHAIRADGHQLRNWITVFYGDLQRRWHRAGLPMEEFPTLPSWIKDSPDGPTASFRDLAP